jgi:hypothetical protein
MPKHTIKSSVNLSNNPSGPKSKIGPPSEDGHMNCQADDRQVDLIHPSLTPQFHKNAITAFNQLVEHIEDYGIEKHVSVAFQCAAQQYVIIVQRVD